jgi:hypothetical protein
VTSWRAEAADDTRLDQRKALRGSVNGRSSTLSQCRLHATDVALTVDFAVGDRDNEVFRNRDEMTLIAVAYASSTPRRRVSPCESA